MKLSIDDIMKIRESLQPEFIGIYERLSNLELATKGSTGDLNIIKDLILDIKDRLDVQQLPFIEKIVDTNCKRLDDHEVRITRLETQKH